MIKRYATVFIAAAAFLCAPASAEVRSVSEQGFVTYDEAVVSADTKAAWLALISPAKWWNSDHTWSGDSANLSLIPQAGGCFCERIPEDPDPDKITLEGSVQHMRVIHAFPERALRMRGGLGPLQSEPATGVLTITMKPVDAGTRIVFEYVVGGFMRFESGEIAKAVDGVISQQLASLTAMLGPAAAAPEDTDATTLTDEPVSVEDAIDALADN